MTENAVLGGGAFGEILDDPLSNRSDYDEAELGLNHYVKRRKSLVGNFCLQLSPIFYAIFVRLKSFLTI